MVFVKVKFLVIRTFSRKIAIMLFKTARNFLSSHELLPKIPELKFYLSELFSNITPAPFDTANLICAEGRVLISRNWRKCPSLLEISDSFSVPSDTGFGVPENAKESDANDAFLGHSLGLALKRGVGAEL